MRATINHFALLGVLAVGLGVGAGAREQTVIDRLRDFRNAMFDRAEPVEKKPRVAQFELFAKPAEVVMLGDSLIESGLWNEMFQGVAIANRGVRGDMAEDLLHRLDTVTNVGPRKVFIMVGINDIYGGRSNQQIVEAYRALVRKISERSITPYVQSTVECARASMRLQACPRARIECVAEADGGGRRRALRRSQPVARQRRGGVAPRVHFRRHASARCWLRRLGASARAVHD